MWGNLSTPVFLPLDQDFLREILKLSADLKGFRSEKEHEAKCRPTSQI